MSFKEGITITIVVLALIISLGYAVSTLDKDLRQITKDHQYMCRQLEELETEINTLRAKNLKLENELRVFREQSEQEESKVESIGDKVVAKITIPTTRSNKGGGSLIGIFEATAYCPCTKCCGPNAKGITASGTKVQANRTIAVDPKVIPLGSKVHIEGFGDYIAEDTGGAIKGYKIDIYFPDHQSALNFGRKKGIKVYWR